MSFDDVPILRRSTFVTIVKCNLSTSFDERHRIETTFHIITRPTTADDVAYRVTDVVVESVETISCVECRFLSTIKAWIIRYIADIVLHEIE
ncbi:hypothetical protein NY2A_b808L [Paramecium bursaria Chlorella virus NY2A]|uniref:Uncharacterized protein b808L n=1 Tax=Paramecium bursaria Chlorella virus NY2A TaxID=46021 RepID=A7IXY3_PBCVN|nr:hypothetical protein NY2A_b808L [Paramecium bursaria Chlorella virus NY2A]ABT15207.1 hypothetical protein NY2A_b808L [Paramecium bursaria Chlorella virus NY2A]